MAHDSITKRAADIAAMVDGFRLGPNHLAQDKAGLAAEIVHFVEEATNGAPKPVLPFSVSSSEEEWSGRGWGIFPIESEELIPLAVFFGYGGEAVAGSELARRQALPDDHDDYLGSDHGVLRCETAMLVWNSTEADPRVALDGEA